MDFKIAGNGVRYTHYSGNTFKGYGIFNQAVGGGREVRGVKNVCKPTQGGTEFF